MQYTEIECTRPETANALRGYLVSEINETEEDPKISAVVEDRKLTITYGHDNEYHRHGWDNLLIGYRDAFELAWPFYKATPATTV